MGTQLVQLVGEGWGAHLWSAKKSKKSKKLKGIKGIKKEGKGVDDPLSPAKRAKSAKNAKATGGREGGRGDERAGVDCGKIGGWPAGNIVRHAQGERT
jgi:hypothetical protein